MEDKSVNAGSRALNGFALQRNSALFILLCDFYKKFKDEKYFICMEHQDDFLFCFLDENDSVKLIEAYQSKKKSPDKWTINAALTDIIIKLMGTGNKLRSDDIIKTESYRHDLYFSSNSSINLEVSNKGVTTVKTINEENCLLSFNNLDSEIQNKIKQKVEKRLQAGLTPEFEYELDSLHFFYVELTRTDNEQKNQLRGKIKEVFEDNIHDSKAAIDTLISLFNKIETTYNQGNKAKLLDDSKRVSSEKINETLKEINDQSKAFDYWRNELKAIKKVLNIRPFEADEFKLIFKSSFDLFKSITEVKHQKILRFVEVNYKSCVTTQEEENVLELFDKLVAEQGKVFNDLTLKAIIYAAYFVATNKKEVSN